MASESETVRQRLDEEAVPPEEVADEELGGGEGEEDGSDEKPPGYDTLDLDDPPPQSYDAVIAAKANELAHGSLTEEAPPSYKQLFGDKNKEAGTQASDCPRRPRVRPHTQSRRRLRNEQSTNTRSTGNVLGWLRGKIPRVTNRLAIGLSNKQKEKAWSFLPRDLQHRHRMFAYCKQSEWRRRIPGKEAMIAVVVLVAVFALPVAMLAMGFTNLSSCRDRIVPIYLIVGGVALMAEVVLHLVLCMCEARSRTRGDDSNNSTIRMLRMCDCIAFFLFIWLLVGSNWALRVGLFSHGRDNCAELTDLSGGGMMGVMENGVASEGLPNTEASCTDCDPSVYTFTMVTVLIQYILGICLVMMCCSNLRQCRRR